MKTKRFFLLPLIIVFVGFNSFSQDKEGFVEVKGGRIWYTVIGNGSGDPLVVVHGGPGGRSCSSIHAYRELTVDRPVIFYDQLESGMSDRPNDTALWKLPFFIDQIDSLKKALNLERFHLLGSSWGGAIVIEYMLTKNTDSVQSVIFSGPLISTPQWVKDAKVLLSRLPQPVQDTIRKYEALGRYNEQAYIDATDIFYANYLMRTGIQNIPILSECKNVPGFNVAIYEYMWGPTEFTATGTLRDFDRINGLKELKVPVLFVAGEYDEVLAETLYMYRSMVPGSEAVIIPGAGHAKTIDNPEDYINAIGNFLTKVEADKKE